MIHMQEPITALVSELDYVKEYDNGVLRKSRETYYYKGFPWGSKALKDILGLSDKPNRWKAWVKRYEAGYRVGETTLVAPLEDVQMKEKIPVKRKPFHIRLTNVETGGVKIFQYTRLAEEFLGGKRSSVDNHARTKSVLNGYKVEKIYGE